MDDAEFLAARHERTGRNKLAPHALVIKRLLENGYNCADIAEYLGTNKAVKVSRQSVAAFVRRTASKEQARSLSQSGPQQVSEDTTAADQSRADPAPAEGIRATEGAPESAASSTGPACADDAQVDASDLGEPHMPHVPSRRSP
jgi:hypothetical protein